MRLIDKPDVREVLAACRPGTVDDYSGGLRRLATFAKSIKASAADAEALVRAWREANPSDVAAAAPSLAETAEAFERMLAEPHPTISTSADPDRVVRGRPVPNLGT